MDMFEQLTKDIERAIAQLEELADLAALGASVQGADPLGGIWARVDALEDPSHVDVLLAWSQRDSPAWQEVAVRGLIALGEAAAAAIDARLLDAREDPEPFTPLARASICLDGEDALARLLEHFGAEVVLEWFHHWYGLVPASSPASVERALDRAGPRSARLILEAHEALSPASRMADAGCAAALGASEGGEDAAVRLAAIFERWREVEDAYWIRQRVAEAFVMLAEPSSAPTLEALMDTEHHATISLALSRLGEEGVEVARALITRWAEDDSRRSRRDDAIRALKRVEGEVATAALRELFDDPAPHVRHMVWHELGRRADAAALDRLCALAVEDEDVLDRDEAREALALHADPCALAFLEAQLDAARALGDEGEVRELEYFTSRWRALRA